MQQEKRTEARVPAVFRGTLTHGDISAPCVIQNMCSRGFLIRHSRELPVGQVVRLTCELYPQQSVECTVQVRHINSEWLGARVVEISDDGKVLCRRFLEERQAAGR